MGLVGFSVNIERKAVRGVDSNTVKYDICVSHKTKEKVVRIVSDNLLEIKGFFHHLFTSSEDMEGYGDGIWDEDRVERNYNMWANRFKTNETGKENPFSGYTLKLLKEGEEEFFGHVSLGFPDKKENLAPGTLCGGVIFKKEHRGEGLSSFVIAGMSALVFTLINHAYEMPLRKGSGETIGIVGFHATTAPDNKFSNKLIERWLGIPFVQEKETEMGPRNIFTLQEDSDRIRERLQDILRDVEIATEGFD